MGAEPWGCFLIVEPITGSNKVVIVDDRLLDWIAVRIPHVGQDHGWHGRAHAIGIGMDGEILAAMVVSDVDKNNWNCQLSIAADSPKWASPLAIRKLLEYPFVQLGVGRVTALCSSDNTRSISMNARLGFKTEGVMRNGFGDNDVVIMGMLRSEADRWLQYKSGNSKESLS